MRAGKAKRPVSARKKGGVMDEAKRAIVKVGDGRGFIVEGSTERFVITAGHCLPTFPPCASITHVSERIYRSILGRLGETPTIWAQCLFVDPIADIALLGYPDNQEFPRHANAFESWVGDAVPFSVTELPTEGKDWPARWPARLLSLESECYGCTLERFGDGPLWILEPESESIQGGMSGSPILDQDGGATGIVVTTSGPHPCLGRDLPGWLLRQVCGAWANAKRSNKLPMGRPPKKRARKATE
jgi:hypothetical protein